MRRGIREYGTGKRRLVTLKLSKTALIWVTVLLYICRSLVKKRKKSQRED